MDAKGAVSERKGMKGSLPIPRRGCLNRRCSVSIFNKMLSVSLWAFEQFILGKGSKRLVCKREREHYRMSRPSFILITEPTPEVLVAGSHLVAEMWDYWLFSTNAPFGPTPGWTRLPVQWILYDYTFSNLSHELTRTVRSSSKVSNPLFQPLILRLSGSQNQHLRCWFPWSN